MYYIFSEKVCWYSKQEYNFLLISGKCLFQYFTGRNQNMQTTDHVWQWRWLIVVKCLHCLHVPVASEGKRCDIRSVMGVNKFFLLFSIALVSCIFLLLLYLCLPTSAFLKCFWLLTLSAVFLSVHVNKYPQLIWETKWKLLHFFCRYWDAA